eukprot:12923387-Prorocentrum_lima.AAC.1
MSSSGSESGFPGRGLGRLGGDWRTGRRGFAAGFGGGAAAAAEGAVGLPRQHSPRWRACPRRRRRLTQTG